MSTSIKFFVLILGVFSASCGKESDVDNTWDYGTSDNYSVEEVQYAVEMILDAYGTHFGEDTIARLKKEMMVRIVWENGTFECGNKANASGCHEYGYNAATIRLLDVGSCIGHTSIAHELLHLVLIAHGDETSDLDNSNSDSYVLLQGYVGEVCSIVNSEMCGE